MDIREEIKILLQSIIREKGLVDTGGLVNSIEVITQVDGDFNFSFLFEGNEYYKYLDEEYQLTNTLINHPTFNEIVDKWLDERLEDILKRII
jgi:hypothetical protein